MLTLLRVLRLLPALLALLAGARRDLADRDLTLEEVTALGQRLVDLLRRLPVHH